VHDKVYELQGQTSRLQSLHSHLLRTYYSSATIALYRPYILDPKLVPLDEQERLRTMAIERCRSAASNTTYSLNELVAADLIDVCPTMISISMMSAMQIHFYEHTTLEGLAKSHALHNLKLHILVLDHLRKTYWSADMQHALFTDIMKAIEGSKRCGPDLHQKEQDNISRPQSSDAEATSNLPKEQSFDLPEPAADMVLGGNDGVLDDFFATFNPFNMGGFDRPYFGNSNDWLLGQGNVP
jgi:hypothetical protein